MGLPTPGAARIERQLRRRMEMWREATPEQRAEWMERQRARREARQAALATPEGRAAFAARQEQMQRWRAQGQGGMALTAEQRAERRELLRAWRAQRMGGPPLTGEERAARREQYRRWREARRARWQAETDRADANMRNDTEGPAAPDR